MQLEITQTRKMRTIRWRGMPLSIAEANALAMKEEKAGNLQNAAGIYMAILAKFRDYAEVHNNLGAILQKLARYEDALKCYDRAIARKPGYANAHFNRGLTLKQMNRHDDALASYDKAIKLHPDHWEAHNNRGVLLQEMRRYAEALADYTQAIAAKPDHAEAYNNRGTLLANLGKMSEAETDFRQASSLRPNFADPIFNLVAIRKSNAADSPEAGHIRRLLERADITATETEQLNFALGKIYDDCGLYDQAFEWYRRANQIRNMQVAYRAGEVATLTDGIINTFGSIPPDGSYSLDASYPSPLFIVGMPRSGTTLLANILSNHHGVAMAGELPTLGNLAGQMPTTDENRYPHAANCLTPGAADRLIRDYLARLRRDVSREARLVVDKNPLNFRYIGLISLAFPNAWIIHCKRNPLDTCLSNYFQRFPLFMDYSFDLENIGHFYSEYSRLMRHWRSLSRLKLIEVNYEDIVLKTEPTVRALLETLGLEWDARCLEPHTNPCAVETASLWQVRQPIYNASLGRWRHYEMHLGPLREILQRTGNLH